MKYLIIVALLFTNFGFAKDKFYDSGKIDPGYEFNDPKDPPKKTYEDPATEPKTKNILDENIIDKSPYDKDPEAVGKRAKKDGKFKDPNASKKIDIYNKYKKGEGKYKPDTTGDIKNQPSKSKIIHSKGPTPLESTSEGLDGVTKEAD